MDPILDLAGRHGLYVIEDCAQAHGATYKGRPVGSMGHVAAFSFCQDKIMTTGGEGGMLVTDDESVWRRAWAFKDHGKCYDAVYGGDPPVAPVFRWLHESIGTNARMTEMQAAIGRAQLRRLDDWVAQRRHNLALLAGALEDLPGLRVPRAPADVGHACYKFYAYLDPAGLRADWSRDRIVGELAERGVPCLSGTCGEIYLEKAFQDAGLASDERLPVAKNLAETSLMLPVHHTLEDRHIARFADEMTAVLKLATA